jgi:hypothetical protein
MKSDKQQIVHNKLLQELKELDKRPIELENGLKMKPSQCYSFSLYPKPHFLFNTNCSEELRDKLQSIFRKYFNESV